MNEYEVGDLVKVISPSAGGFSSVIDTGAVGPVTKVNGSTGGVWATIEGREGKRHELYFFSTEVEKYIAPEVKIGDKVRILKPFTEGDETFAAGTVGTVRIANSVGTGVDFIKSDGETLYHPFWARENALELVETPTEEPLAQWEKDLLAETEGLKVGDRVKIVASDSLWGGRYGKLIRDDESDIPYKVEFAPGVIGWFYKTDVVRAEPEPEPSRLKIGDRVKINADTVTISGHGGTGEIVRECDSGGWDWEVKLDAGGRVVYYERELELIRDTDPEEPAPLDLYGKDFLGDIKVGDRVRTVGDSWAYKDTEYEVTGIIGRTTSTRAEVKLLGEDREFQIVLMPGWEIEKIEPEPEVEGIKAGDMVFVTFLPHYGKTARVTQVYPDSDTVAVTMPVFPGDAGTDTEDYGLASHEVEKVKMPDDCDPQEYLLNTMREALVILGRDAGERREQLAETVRGGLLIFATKLNKLKTEGYNAGVKKGHADGKRLGSVFGYHAGRNSMIDEINAVHDKVEEARVGLAELSETLINQKAD